MGPLAWLVMAHRQSKTGPSESVTVHEARIAPLNPSFARPEPGFCLGALTEEDPRDPPSSPPSGDQYESSSLHITTSLPLGLMSNDTTGRESEARSRAVSPPDARLATGNLLQAATPPPRSPQCRNRKGRRGCPSSILGHAGGPAEQHAALG